jgi:hypothetical protein
MATPDTGPPAITDYYFGGSVSGWNTGTWNEKPGNTTNVTLPQLHNFAPILITDFNTERPLTFNLCGNGYFYGPPSGSILYADVLIVKRKEYISKRFTKYCKYCPKRIRNCICYNFR